MIIKSMLYFSVKTNDTVTSSQTNKKTQGILYQMNNHKPKGIDNRCKSCINRY